MTSSTHLGVLVRNVSNHDCCPPVDPLHDVVNIQPKLAITYRMRAIAVPAVVAPSPARTVAAIIGIAAASAASTVLGLALVLALRHVHLVALDAVNAGLLHNRRGVAAAVAQV